jgi:hypothetical protein
LAEAEVAAPSGQITTELLDHRFHAYPTGPSRQFPDSLLEPPILEVDMAGKELRRWEVDSNGQKLDGGINDIVIIANGGAYATLSGGAYQKLNPAGKSLEV